MQDMHRQVGELMRSTATMLEGSVLATQQQKSAADHVDAALQQIRAATEQLAIGQQLRFAHAEKLEELVRDLGAAVRPTAQSTAAILSATETGGHPRDLAHIS
jgi:methyl-accepting chemotaxis protein